MEAEDGGCDIPAAMKGANGRTGGRVSKSCHVRVAAPSDQSIDVHTGVGNFLNGTTPNQDILMVVLRGGGGRMGAFYGRRERFNRPTRALFVVPIFRNAWWPGL